jgi:homopolymeric O-antigen transport system ATP-binding protein
MIDTVIKVENLGKQYRLGQVGTGTLATDVNRWWHKVRGKEDPYLKVGEVNDRSIKGEGDLVWALKNINFEVKQGEVLGIIGKNGAGKSTLLKILSQVTGPTIGDIKVKGRIASLLEVGTGFHPDLSGKENIFLNGAILGMSKNEIKSKFDEIVAFSGVERYIDTPVKRYSSGMYIRLAFAVAAHLEPEILIVDEVLAVGDAEFQKKCLGKMKAVSSQGRTVLFVSHNMPSIRALCDSVLVMKNGEIVSKGETNEMISSYLSAEIVKETSDNGIIPETLSSYNSGEAKFKKLQTLSLKGMSKKTFYFKEMMTICCELEAFKHLENVIVLLLIKNSFGENILMAVDNEMYKPFDLAMGLHEFTVNFNEHLMPGDYSIGLTLCNFHTGGSIDSVESFGHFKVIKETESKDMEYPWETVHGYTRPNTRWTKRKIN